MLTDKDSVIALDGANPKSLEDTVALAAQKAALLKFKESLDGLIKEHDAVTSGKTPRVTKIKVKKAN